MTASVPELEFGGERKDAADFHARAGRIFDPRVGIAQDGRAVAQAVIDVFVAVDVPDPRALAARDVNRRILTPIAEVGGDAEGQAPDGFLKVLVTPFQRAAHNGSSGD
jgi:hypothetical protein